MKNKKIVAIIQARMGSTRLQGKILMDIAGRPMLWQVVNRIRNCYMVDEIVVASTIESEDDAVEDFCGKNGINCFRGSEDDVLDRYYQAASINNADVVVRITADCPLIDPVTVDKVLAEYLSKCDEYDGASNVIERTYPRGLDTEVFSFPALAKIWAVAKKAHEREHVTVYFYEHPEEFNMFSVKNNKDLSSFRWTVDEESDLTMVRKIFENFKGNKNIFSASDIVAFFKTRPDVKAFNENVEQKKII
ncbi:MAG: glycosyltransferase family protein [Candidatus Omnitrophota bacterium]